MKKIGYIVTKSRIKGIKGFVKVVNDISLADPTKPILIVGYNVAKEHPKFETILDKELDDGLYWTFRKVESRSDYEDDLEKFYEIVIAKAVKSVKYYYVNVLTLSLKKAKAMLTILDAPMEKNVFINKSMIYFCVGESVCGISINIMRYIGIRYNKIMERLSKFRNLKIITKDYEGIKNLLSEIGYENKYLIPFLINE